MRNILMNVLGPGVLDNWLCVYLYKTY